MRGIRHPIDRALLDLSENDLLKSACSVFATAHQEFTLELQVEDVE